MRIEQWLRPPRRLLLIFLGTTLTFLVAIGWLGWGLLQQVNAVEIQRVRDQLERSTDLVAAEIRQKLTNIDADLGRLSALRQADLDRAAFAFGNSLGQDGLGHDHPQPGLPGPLRE